MSNNPLAKTDTIYKSIAFTIQRKGCLVQPKGLLPFPVRNILVSDPCVGENGIGADPVGSPVSSDPCVRGEWETVVCLSRPCVRGEWAIWRGHCRHLNV